MAAEIAPEEIIKILYRAALRRTPDDAGLATYLRLLNDGVSPAELLVTLMESDEFHRHILVPADHLPDFRPLDEYRPELDRDITRFLTPEVRDFGATIRKFHLDIDHFRKIAKECVDHIYSYNQEFGDSQKGYFDYHERRFYEIDGVVKALIQQDRAHQRPAVLDFGFSINSHILKRLFNANEITLDIADRPQISPPASEFDGLFAVDLSVDNIAEIELGKKFDVIIFSEVIEHVMINPIKILRFLVNQITPDGYVIVTTPNLFSQHKLQAIGSRKNPLPPYPLDYGRAEAPHFHVREYCMSEMLIMIEAAGAKIRAFFFSDCWDPPSGENTIPEHELGNLFLVLGK